MTDYSKALGANHPLGTKHVVLFVPGKDKNGRQIRQKYNS